MLQYGIYIYVLLIYPSFLIHVFKQSLEKHVTLYNERHKSLSAGMSPFDSHVSLYKSLRKRASEVSLKLIGNNIALVLKLVCSRYAT